MKFSCLFVLLLMAVPWRCGSFTALTTVNVYNPLQRILPPRLSVVKFKPPWWKTPSPPRPNNNLKIIADTTSAALAAAKNATATTTTNLFGSGGGGGGGGNSRSSWSLQWLPLQRNLIFPSSIDFPSAQFEDTHQRYLQRHQIVKKRRVLKRIVEISSILSGQILRPLLCSIVKTTKLPEDLSQLHLIPTDQDWDEFWNQRRGKRKLTNAERVAKGVPALGPTFVKAAHILATRPDIFPLPLAEALGSLQDDLPPFDDATAKRMIRTDILDAMARDDFWSHYIQTKDDLYRFMNSLSKSPVAAGSIASVYKGELPGYGPVAIKVLRPGARAKVERDATLFHSIATWIESWNNNTLQLPLARQLQLQKPLGSLQLVSAVDEFTSRVLEDMDFTREAENMKVFAQLYCSRIGTSPTVKVVVPEVIPELCSQRVLLMEWIQGTKLTDVCGDCDTRPQEVKENLELITAGIEMTISQLIDHGVIHGEPHSGNLLKVKRNGKVELGYLDFGVVSTIPQKFRDGIVIAIVQLVFARNIEAVADLCVDLDLLPPETLQDAGERKRFLEALQNALDQVLIWPKCPEGISTAVPTVRFENVLPAFIPLIQNYAFTVPPYYLNNIRVLATLEGIALKLDPNFNVLRVVYPYSINRLMRNPNVSKKVQDTFLEICRSPKTKLISPQRVKMLLTDWSLWTGCKRRRIAWDLITCAGGRRVTPVILYNFFLNRWQNVKTMASYTRQVAARGRQKILRLLSLLLGGRQQQPASF